MSGNGKYELPDHCIRWLGRLNCDGYGVLTMAGKVGAHRAIYEMFVGPIPDGLHVLHSCDNPACINPRHLRVGTHQENIGDKVARGRSRPGTLSPNSKLKAWMVERIRGGLECKPACQEFGITRSTYYRARARSTYANELVGSYRG